MNQQPTQNTAQSKVSLPVAFFVGQQVLLKENEPGNVLKMQRCTLKKHGKSNKSIYYCAYMQINDVDVLVLN